MGHVSSTVVVAPTVTRMTPEAEQSSPMVNPGLLLVTVYRQGGALTEKFPVQSQSRQHRFVWAGGSSESDSSLG
jgi:hypothetical protein